MFRICSNLNIDKSNFMNMNNTPVLLKSRWWWVMTHILAFLLLKTSKANLQKSIPAIIMKENCDIFSKKLHIDFLQAIYGGIFPNKMKNADVSPVFKKGDRINICNYRPVSILPSDSKIFEKLVFSQINNPTRPYINAVFVRV